MLDSVMRIFLLQSQSEAVAPENKPTKPKPPAAIGGPAGAGKITKKEARKRVKELQDGVKVS